MANEKHLRVLKQGVEIWNQWCEKNFHGILPDLSGVDLRKANLRGAYLSGADLRRADLSGADLSEATLSGADLSEAILSKTYLGGADLSEAKLIEAKLIEAKLIEANLRGAYLNEAVLSWADLSKADLSKADLSKADLYGVKLTKANLTGAVLVKALLTKAILRDADLSGETDLSQATFLEANLREAKLNGANLSGADFSRTKLHGANLSGAVLSKTYLGGANLSRANFSETILTEARLTEAKLGWTQFNNVDLSVIDGLATVKHVGPSTIGIDTIYKSKGKIPNGFLRGAGVPDTLIAQIPALIGALQPIEYYSCFISYSHKNEDFAKRLHSRMRDEHLRVWFAPEDMRAGRKVHEQIEEAIRYYDKLLLVLSEDSMDSQWVETEIYYARQREIEEERRVLFPIRLVDFERIRDWTCFDADTGRDMAREIREYYIPDFSHWKDHDAFEAAFDRLLRDLKAEEPDAP